MGQAKNLVELSHSDVAPQRYLVIIITSDLKKPILLVIHAFCLEADLHLCKILLFYFLFNIFLVYLYLYCYCVHLVIYEYPGLC